MTQNFRSHFWDLMSKMHRKKWYETNNSRNLVPNLFRPTWVTIICSIPLLSSIFLELDGKIWIFHKKAIYIGDYIGKIRILSFLWYQNHICIQITWFFKRNLYYLCMEHFIHFLELWKWPYFYTKLPPFVTGLVQASDCDFSWQWFQIYNKFPEMWCKKHTIFPDITLKSIIFSRQLKKDEHCICALHSLSRNHAWPTPDSHV